MTKGKSSKSIVLAQPSTVTYKDVSIKFSPRHDTKSFLEVLYTNLCQECAIAEALINPDFVVPELPRGSDSEAKKDFTRHFGNFKVETDVKRIISFVYNLCCQQYQQAISTKFDSLRWKLLKTVPELMSVVKFITEMKIKEKGSKSSVVAKARKAISSIQQKDYEDGATYVTRMQKLWEDEKSITTAYTSKDMVIEHLKDGLRPTYNSLIEHWQIQEITSSINDESNSMPTNLEEFASVLTNYEQRSRKLSSIKPGSGNPNNFVIDNDTTNNRGKGKHRRGCITCSIAGRDANHDFKTCTHSIKWRSEKEKKLLLTEKRKNVDREETPTTSTKRGKNKKQKKVKFDKPDDLADDDDVADDE